MSFAASWDRVKAETPLKTLNDLARLVETSQPNVSRRKKEKNFPPEWAYRIAQEFGLLTEWIMTGEGPKTLSDTGKFHEMILQGSLAEWLKERCQEDPNFYREFMAECVASFPEYAEWLKKRKGGLAEGGVAQQKIA